MKDNQKSSLLPAIALGMALAGFVLVRILTASALSTEVRCAFRAMWHGPGFALNIGTVFFTFLALFFAWRAARRAGGRWAGVAAVAFCMVGLMPFVHYSVSPRGGYGVLMFMVAALLDAAGAMVADERRNSRCRLAVSFWAGLVLGIAFWCNWLALPAVLAAGVGVIVFSPRVLARIRFWIGLVLGFAIGSAPFWKWNAANGWESFGMVRGIVLDPAVVASNALMLITDGIPAFFGVDGQYATGPACVAVLLAAVILIALSLLAFAPPPRRIDVPYREVQLEAKAQITVCWLFLAFFAACFATLHFAAFNAPRYLPATFPALAILAGVSCAIPRHPAARIASAVCLAALVAWQARQYPLVLKRAAGDAATAASYQEVCTALISNGCDVAYCAFRHNTLNICSPPGHGANPPVFTDAMLERRPDFRSRAESAELSPAVVNDFLGISSWIRAGGGSATFMDVGGMKIAMHATPPPPAGQEIPSSEWALANGDEGKKATLCDRSLGTSVELAGASATLTIRFSEPKDVCGIRAIVSGFEGRCACRIEGRATPDGPFERITHDVPYVPAIWSGPRFYPVRDPPPVDVRFNPRSLDALRIVFGFATPSCAVRKVHELQILAPPTSEAKPIDWNSAVTALLGELRKQGVRRLYATRWVANTIDGMSHGEIWTNCGEDLHPRETGNPRPHEPPAPVVFDHSTALLASPSGTAPMRDVLATSLIAMREIPCGALGTLFVPESVQRVPLDIPSGILFDADLPVIRPEPHWMESRIAALNDEAATNEEAAREFTRVLASNPNCFTAVNVAHDNARTDAGKQAAWSAMRGLLSPRNPLQMRDAEFGREFYRWNGTAVVSPEQGTLLRPGETIRLRHYWQAPRPPPHGALRVFTHFVSDNGYRFQDDFAFDIPPEGPEIEVEPYGGDPMIWHNDRVVTIPPDAPEGEYEMRVGIYDAVYPSRRLRVRAYYTRTRRGAAVAPDFFSVIHAKEPAQ